MESNTIPLNKQFINELKQAKSLTFNKLTLTKARCFKDGSLELEFNNGHTSRMSLTDIQEAMQTLEYAHMQDAAA